ncbi:hypothetical protein JKP88DRAFT_329622 [Tribonema minus]|uniref:Plastid lipid-associated protein/fibrillin conserved domain-containing protein n=1 Tax=Tribonema minus TaxID=303371 RepID=A0A836CAZ2_9STRA|nr:hypothetical protein JKP88DRAFT_329622 [Tribonema minus]
MKAPMLIATAAVVIGYGTAFFAARPRSTVARPSAVGALTMQVSYDYQGSSSSAYEDKLDAKSALLSAIGSGVGKGYYMTSRSAAKDIKKAIVDLETSGADMAVKFPSDFATLDGRWKLLYSSNIFGVGRLSPLTLDEVYQVVDTAGNSIKNVVYATLSPPLFETTWGRFPVQAVANAAKRVNERISFPVDFALDHTFEITSAEYPAQLKIALKETKIVNCEKPEQRSLAVPAIRPLAQIGAGKFDTTYMDDDLRISRGTLGEIRVFQRSTEDASVDYSSSANYA